jgi:very-short-patch-repair endonuclease
MSEVPEPLRVEVEADRSVQFALHQNDVALVKRVRIGNTGASTLRDVRVAVTVDSGIAAGSVFHIDAIAAGSTHNLEHVDLRLEPERLRAQTEREKTVLRVVAEAAGASKAEEARDLDVLAFDEWPGLRSLPPLLASFVLPNDPALAPLLGRVAERLRDATGDGSLDGYQSRDPARARAVVAAVHDALCDAELTYAEPPASFEDVGQRVRLPSRVLGDRLATCLDLTLLAAALLEQSGLRPLLVLVEGHAFVGAWLRPEGFDAVAEEDGLRLRKRIDVGDIVVFETTAAVVDRRSGFTAATAAARARLVSLDGFRAVIDVVEARRVGFRPLPQRDASAESPAPGLGAAIDLPRAQVDDPQPVPPPAVRIAEPAVPETRLERWRRRLLDLGLRNRLIAFAESKKTLRLVVDDVAALEAALSRGGTFELVGRAPATGTDGPSPAERSPADERARRRILVDHDPLEVERRAVEIYRHARSALEESGSSTLYLGLGTLVWYESPSSSTPRRAPLLLLPLVIARPSIREAVQVGLADDEARVNVTLLEKLQQDFDIDVSALRDLPEDESGVDVRGFLQRFRRAVLEVDRFEVLDEAWIAPFSFTKFLMWADLQERAATLMEAPVLRHLVERSQAGYEPGAEFPDPEELDAILPAADTLCPLDADSSQLAAVRAAEQGRSFVLEGPPGTGKSQTITNLIAQCLAGGQRVLFVSEKMAALQVVQRRLDAVGLGPFCLELHSNRSNRREVVEQLMAVLDGARSRGSATFDGDVARLEEERDRLNRFARLLHEPGPFGESLFEVTARLCGLREAPLVLLPLGEPRKLDVEAVRARREAVGQLGAAVAATGHPSAHPLRLFQRAEFEARLAERVVSACRDAEQALDVLREQLEVVESLLGARSGSLVSMGPTDLEHLVAVCDLAIRAPGVARRALEGVDWVRRREALAAAIAMVEARNVARDTLLWVFEKEVFALDLAGLAAQWERARQTFWPLSWWRGRAVARALAPVAKDRVGPQGEERTRALATAQDIVSRSRDLAAAGHPGALEFGDALWSVGDPEGAAGVDRLRRALDWIGEVRGAIGALVDALAPEDAQGIREVFVALVTERRDELEPGRRVGAAFAALLDAHAQHGRAQRALFDLVEIDETQLRAGVADLGALLACYRSWKDHTPERLRTYCHWRRMRAAAVAVGLGPLVAAVEDPAGAVRLGELEDAFERGFREAWLDAVTDGDERLRTFHGREHERRIARFRALDRACIDAARDVVAARLWAMVPVGGARTSDASEVGIVRREARKKRRHLAVRRLLASIPNLLPRLKPCFLMSPLSVAQYLTDEVEPFDLVVFDEASQITPWDAVGAIARARRCIVVGDTKQLPPTSFFQRADEGEDDFDDGESEDLESILDECVAAGLSSMQLRWHYRSQHESLIAFSNHHYYENRLLTFPGPEAISDRFGVSLRPVPDGVYDRSKSRQNRAEAESVVADVVARLSTGLACGERVSLGVVTFSQAQQQLIEDLLDAARRERPALDAAFAGEEPVFVKNLENVQGDERDAILFSIGYGPDAHGRVAMHFGPLNRPGGERRLNVAVTRARRQVVVHATLRADQIDLSRTSAVGVRHLKTFLDYAARGPAAIAEAVEVRVDAEYGSPFEVEVAEALRARGHDVELQVGCSGYRIDLAVRDPARPGRFLLGIECDGATYHAARTARDRDRLRAAVLERLGWTLCRIWSTDWWRDRAQEIERVEAAIADAALSRPAPDPAPEVASPPMDPPSSEQRSAALDPTPPDDFPSGSDRADAGPTEAMDGDATYVPWTAEPAAASAPLPELIVELVEAEGPVHVDGVSRRVAAIRGASRVGSRLRAEIAGTIDALGSRVQVIGEFLWPPAMTPDAWRGFRVADPAVEGSLRRPAELPLEEIANAVVAVLRAQVAMPWADLVRETRSRLGFGRTGTQVEEAMERGIRRAIDTGRAAERDGVVCLP